MFVCMHSLHSLSKILKNSHESGHQTIPVIYTVYIDPSAHSGGSLAHFENTVRFYTVAPSDYRTGEMHSV